MGYTTIEQKAVVNYYFEHDQLSLQAVVAHAGYPTPRTLGKWVKDDPRWSVERKYARYDYGKRVFASNGGNPDKDCPHSRQIRSILSGEATLEWVGPFVEGKSPMTVIKLHDPEGTEGTFDRDARSDEIASLKRQLKEAQLELDVARAKIAVLKKEEGLSMDMTTDELVEVVSLLRPKYGLSASLRKLGVPRSTYYYRIAAVKRADKYERARESITRIFDGSGGTYGYRRVHDSLKNDGITLAKGVIARLMRELGLRVQISKKDSPYRSYKGDAWAAPDMLKRDFTASAPNEKWVTDITQVYVCGEKVYISPIIDLFNGEVVSCAASLHPNMELVMSMLWAAIPKLGENDIPILHSDRGCQYTSPSWRLELERQCIIQSMSRKGNCLDNACAESFFSRMKLDMYHGRNYSSVEEFAQTLAAYIDWYNSTRIKSKLGGLSPVEYRRAWEERKAA